MGDTSPDTVTIELFGGAAPSMVRIVAWTLLGNLVVLGVSAVFFFVIPFLSGDWPELTLGEIVGIGVVATAVALGIALFMWRKHTRGVSGKPAATLTVGPDEVVLRQEGEVARSAPRSSGGVRLKHFYEEVDGQAYFVGPALSVDVGEETVVLALLDGSVRWQTDPASVAEADWVCTREGWDELVGMLDLDEQLVAY